MLHDRAQLMLTEMTALAETRLHTARSSSREMCCLQKLSPSLSYDCCQKLSGLSIIAGNVYSEFEKRTATLGKKGKKRKKRKKKPKRSQMPSGASHGYRFKEALPNEDGRHTSKNIQLKQGRTEIAHFPFF